MTAETNTGKAALKTRIIDAMVALEQAELDLAEAHVAGFLKDTDLDETDSHTRDDIALARENADLAYASEAPVRAHSAKLDALEHADFSPKDSVSPGAVVCFGDRRLVVSVATTGFEVDGVRYMGVSVQSPAYRAMAGLRAGDSFTLSGQAHEIAEVF